MSPSAVYDNPFYRLLIGKYRLRFEQAQKQRWMVLIPKASSLRNVRIDSKFVGYHILRPSPLLVDHFTCTDSVNTTTLVEWDISSDCITCHAGFKYQKNVTILAQELAYNSSYEQYRILLTNEPLHTAPSRRPRGISSAMASKSSKLPPSYQESRAYLLSVPVLSQFLKIIDEKMENFNKNYVVLPRFIDDTVNRLRSVVDTALELISSSGCLDEQPMSVCVQNYIAGMAHQKIFAAIKTFCKNDDSDLERRLEFLRESHVTAETLGVTDETFFCELPKSIVELASLDAKYTSLDKIWCLRTTLQCLQQEVEDHVANSGAAFKYGDDLPPLTSDILIPLLVLVIVRARMTHLSSNLFYMEHFCQKVDDYTSFTLSTFQAANVYIKSYNMSSIHTSPVVPKKELSLVDLMEVTASINDNSEDSVGCVDRKLEEVTRLIEAQTLDFHLKEEAHLRHLDELNSGNNSSTDDASTSSASSFSPLSSLRRSLRTTRNS